MDRIRVRDADATQLVQFISARNAEEYVLELRDNPELSATYDVSNLITAMKANKMMCLDIQ